jgi:membrane-bound metal-dependent hydrolase YbcI (DUF457 family)
MLGHSHALSGAAAGLAAGILVHMTPAHTAAFALATAGMALLPDLDSVGACASRSLGLISEAVAVVVRKLSGGHRHGTHEWIGTVFFGGLATLGYVFRHDDFGLAVLALLVTIAVAGALEALRFADRLVADLFGIAAAVAVAGFGFDVALIPAATVLGVVTHVAGDMMTWSGCVYVAPFSERRLHLTPRWLRFTTGTLAELWIVDPILTVAVGLLAVDTAWPGFAAAAIHAA